MRNARLLIHLLLCATVLVDLVVVSVVLADPGSRLQPNVPRVFVVFSLMMSQVNLLAAWIGFAGRSLPWRIVALVLTVVLWSTVVGIVGDAVEPLWSAGAFRSLFIVLFLAQAVFVFATLWMARFAGAKLVRTSDVASTGQAVCGRTRLQFSLGTLLAWITTIAVVLGLFQWGVTNYGILELLVDVSVAIWLLENAAFVLLALWAALGTRHLLLQLLVAALAVSAAVLTRYTLANADGDRMVYSALTISTFVLQLGFLAVFRVAGYRLMGRAWKGTPDPTSVGEDS